MTTSGIVTCTFHETLWSIRPFLTELWEFLLTFRGNPGRFLAVVRYLLLDRLTYEAENLHGSPQESPPCPYGIGVRPTRGYPGEPGHLLNCTEISFLAKYWPYFAVLTRMNPDDPDSNPVPSSGIFPCSPTRNLGSNGPLLSEIWVFLFDF